MKKLLVALALAAGALTATPRAEATPVPCLVCGSSVLVSPGMEATVSYAVISGASFAAELGTHGIGFGGATCVCDTCADGTPCNDDSQCPGVGDSCGTLRCLGGANANAPCTTPGVSDPVCMPAPCGNLGEPTKPNSCTGASNCTAGSCPTGPFNGFCGPVETFRGCLAPSDCPFPGDTCSFIAQPCLDSYTGTIGDTITATGAPDLPVNDSSDPTLASTFCIAPVAAGSINSATGLPGPGRVTLTGTANGLP